MNFKANPPLYKLTTQCRETRAQTENPMSWGEGITHTATGPGRGLCSDGFIHAYTDPLLAVLFNPIQANISNPILWECEGEAVLSDRGVKVGCKTLTTVREIPLPQISIEQSIAFGILCALEVCKDPDWMAWANKWLSDTDRSLAAAKQALELARKAALVAAEAVEVKAKARWPKTATEAKIIDLQAAATARWAAMQAALAATGRWPKTTSALAAMEAAEAAAKWKTEAVIDLLTLAKKAMEY